MTRLLFDVIWIAVLVMTAYALVDAVRRPAPAFEAHGKLTKQIWLAILVASGLAVYFFGFLSLLGIPALVAVIVYIVDVKPAVSGSANPWA